MLCHVSHEIDVVLKQPEKNYQVPDLRMNYQKYNGKEFEQFVPYTEKHQYVCNTEQYFSHKIRLQ